MPSSAPDRTLSLSKGKGTEVRVVAWRAGYVQISIHGLVVMSWFMKHCVCFIK